MGKSSTKAIVDASTTKPLNKGNKRSAEQDLDMKLDTKKQKKELIAAVQKETAAKKVESSSSDSSDSEEEQKKVVAKKPPTKLKDDSSSDDESSDEEMIPATKKTVAKNVPFKAKAKADSSSSEEESSSDEDEDEPAPVKEKPATLAKSKAESSSSEDESSSSDEDEEVPVPVKEQPTTVEKEQPKTVAKAKEESSSSEDGSSSDEEPTPEKKPATTIDKAKAESSSSEEESSSDEEEKPASAPVKKPATTIKKVEAESSSSEDESSSDEEEPALPKKQPEVVKPAVKDSSSSEDGESDSDDETPPKKKSKVSPTKTSKESSSDDSDEEESEDEKVTPKKKDSDVEMVEAEQKSNAKLSKTPTTQTQGGSKTIFAGNLSFSIERSDVEKFFKEAGEIVGVRFSSDENGRLKGYGHVEFASQEAAQKALALNGKKLLGRDVRLNLAKEKGFSTTPRNSNPGSNYENARKGEASKSKTIFVKGFDTSLSERETRNALRELFETCGKVSRIAVPNDRETGVVKGIAYIDFENGIDKALELNGSELGGRRIVVNEDKPREDSNVGSFSNGRNSDNRGRFSTRNTRGVPRGRFSNPRSSGRTPNKPSLFDQSKGKKIVFGDDE